jgi:small-conductance mechanosensitive channel
MIDFSPYVTEISSSGILFFVYLLLRVMVTKLVRKFAKSSEIIEHRTNLVLKYIHLLLTILFGIGLIIIWGVNTKDIVIAISSITTVVGVAMVANWSILSNITSGVILFFSFPFKIGDLIKVHDKDYPIEGEIEDIGAFHVYLKTKNGEQIIYPNNLFFQKGISILKEEYQEKEFTD